MSRAIGDVENRKYYFNSDSNALLERRDLKRDVSNTENRKPQTKWRPYPGPLLPVLRLRLMYESNKCQPPSRSNLSRSNLSRSNQRPAQSTLTFPARPKTLRIIHLDLTKTLTHHLQTCSTPNPSVPKRPAVSSPLDIHTPTQEPSNSI